MKALILAAGLGTRLRPLTLDRPKPLCPYLGIPLLDLAFWQIKKAGVQYFACNTHYLNQKIEDHISKNRLYQSQSIDIFYEPQIRGTGGSLYSLRDWIEEDQSLLIYNGDIIASIDLCKVSSFHKEHQADATMVLLHEDLTDKNPVRVDPITGNVIGFGRSQKNELQNPNNSQFHTFTGIHIVSSAFVESIPVTTPWSIIDTYQERIARGMKIKAFLLEKGAFWHDLGTPFSYWQAHENLFNFDIDQQLIEIGVHHLRELNGMSPLKILKAQKSIITEAQYKQNQIPQLSRSFLLTEHTQSNTSIKLEDCLVLPEVELLSQSYQKCMISRDHVITFQ